MRNRLPARHRLVLATLALLLLFGLVPHQAFANSCDDVNAGLNSAGSSTTGSSNSTTGGALSPCQKLLYEEGIDAFDVTPSGTAQQCGDSGAQAVTDATGTNRAEAIWNFFGGKGLTPVAIAGIMGNFHQEDSPFDPAEKQNHSTVAIPDNGNGHTGFGIAQWTSQDRQALLFAQIRQAGLQQYYGQGWGNPNTDKDKMPAQDVTSLLNVELNFAWSGDTTKVQDIASQLNNTSSPDGDNGSTVLFHHLFERSRDNASQIQQRVTDADRFLKQFGNTPATAASSSDSCAGVLGGVSSIDDAKPWALRFVSDTTAAYHPGGNDLSGKTINDGGGTITPLHHTNDGTVGGGSCWGGTYCGQCTALSGWFVTKMTGYTFAGGNGGQVVGKMKATGVPTGSQPRAFSVFSYATGGSTGAGHTGVVLGVLAGGQVITIENNWPPPGQLDDGQLTIREYNIKKEHPDATFAYVGDKLKVSGLSTGQSGSTGGTSP